MKVFKVATIAIALIASTASFASGIEEACKEVAETDVRIKQVLQEDPSSLEDLLKMVDSTKSHPKVKSNMRERIFWSYNRRDLSDELLERMAFIRCLTRTK